VKGASKNGLVYFFGAMASNVDRSLDGIRLREQGLDLGDDARANE
jgi:hypothetical protein